MVEYAKKFCLSGHAQAVQAMAVFPEGDRLISVGDDQRLVLWNLATGAQIYSCAGHRGPITTVQVFGDGHKVITGSLDKNAIIWDVDVEDKPLTLNMRLEGHAGSVMAVAVLPGAGVPGCPNLLGNRSSGKAPDSVGGTSIVGGDRVLTGSSDAMVIAWNVDTGRVIETLSEHYDAITSLAVFPQGGKVISGSSDKTAKIWTSDWACIRILQHSAGVNAVGVLPDGEQVVTGTAAGGIVVWDVAKGEEVISFRGHEQPVRSLAIFPFDLKVMTGSDDKQICVWDIETGTKCQTLDHMDCISSVMVTPGETMLVTAGRVDKKIIVWEGGPDCCFENPEPTGCQFSQCLIS